MKTIKIVIFSEEEKNNIGLQSFYRLAFEEIGTSVRKINYEVNANYQRIAGKIPFFYPMATNRLSFDMNEFLDFEPDIIIVFKGAYLNATALRQIKDQTKAQIWNIYPDHPMANPGPKQIYHLAKSLEVYDIIFTFARSLIPVFYQLGVSRVEYLPFAYCEKVHRPDMNSDTIKHSELSYFGTWGRLQDKWLNYLQDYDLKIYGTGWQNLENNSPLKEFVIPEKGLGEEMSVGIAKSKIVFNMVRAEHGSFHTMKTFEIPACGGFMLTNRTEEQEQFFRDGFDVVFFDNKIDMLDKINYYLQHEEERLRIIENAKKTVEKHSYINRAKFLLNYYAEQRRN